MAGFEGSDPLGQLFEKRYGVGGMLLQVLGLYRFLFGHGIADRQTQRHVYEKIYESFTGYAPYVNLIVWDW